MKQISILFVFISVFTYSQNREYHFDYLLEYEITFHKQNFTETKYYLTNSKDNSYLGTLKDSDSLNFELRLVHQDKLVAKVKVIEAEFYKAEFINIACENVYNMTNNYKYQTKNYDFHILKDTVINEIRYSSYKLESHEKLNKKIRKGIGTNFYIIDHKTAFHLPILQHPTAYEEWKLNKSSIPNGIFKELTFINPLNEVHSTKKLKSYYQIDKKIVIVGKCYEPVKFGK